LPGLIGAIAVDLSRVSAPLFILALVLVLLKSVPLWWRRRRPVAVLAIVVAAVVTGEVLGISQSASDGAVIFGVYAVSVYGGSRARLVIVALAAVGTLSVFIAALATVNLSNHRESLLTLGPPALVAWMIGDYIRGRRAFFSELISRHRRESETLRRQAVEEERLRIARELHDVVAHNVSVMAIQAGAARVSGNSSAEALQSIETTARDTLAELNRLLGILRKQPEAPLAPQPGLDDVDALVKTASDAGLEATLKIIGDKRPLPAALDLTAYRIIQEAITNALKHARASRLDVRIAYLPHSLELTIRDNGGGESEAAVKASTGHGLIGMRERVALFGGELEAGSSAVGGFTVRSKLPFA
jgi:signal transduction histidine kinase